MTSTAWWMARTAESSSGERSLLMRAVPSGLTTTWWPASAPALNSRTRFICASPQKPKMTEDPSYDGCRRPTRLRGSH